MAEKGVVEESISQRLRRKRDAYYREKERDDASSISSGVKKRKGNQKNEVDHQLCTSDEKLHSQEQDTEAEVIYDAEHSDSGSRCDRSFFCVDCETLAERLLGSVLVRRLPSGAVFKGKIVETEAYLGGEDKAAHSYNGKRTERNTAMFMQPGTAYVYSIYGMHCCFNISSEGEGAAVLVRALEPLEGAEIMREKRKAAKKDKDLCSGPAKLCQAMAIDKSCNKVDLVLSDSLWVESRAITTPLDNTDIVKSIRIGVDYAEEWSKKLLRFYIKGNSCVSKK